MDITKKQPEELNESPLRTIRTRIIYLFPLVFDIIVSLSLFVSRHSFAEKGMDAKIVGAISIIYGTVYIGSSLIMSRIIKPNIAKLQMLISNLLAIIFLCILANLNSVSLILIIFMGIPFSTCFFFNAFQAFLLKTETETKKPLTKTVGHFTIAWSIGFALGPIISALLKKWVSWSVSYYVAALLALAIGILALFFKPTAKGNLSISEKSAGPLLKGKEKALPLPGWIGIFIAVSGWIAISTFWPIQARKMGFNSTVKGAVEFVYAISQALSAYIICNFSTWYHKPKLLPVMAFFGVSGAVIFSFSNSPFLFALGSMCYGIYSGSVAIYAVYHCMLDRDKAVKRVAFNELIVGFSFVAGPFISFIFLGQKMNFRNGYLFLACYIGIGVLIQTWIAERQIRK